jgi:hypothetical protein
MAKFPVNLLQAETGSYLSAQPPFGPAGLKQLGYLEFPVHDQVASAD